MARRRKSPVRERIFHAGDFSTPVSAYSNNYAELYRDSRFKCSRVDLRASLPSRHHSGQTHTVAPLFQDDTSSISDMIIEDSLHIYFTSVLV